MDGCNWFVKKIHLTWKNGWLKLILEKKPVLFVNGRLLLLSSNKMTHYSREWATASGVLKKICCLYKNLMLQIDPLNSNYLQKLEYPERKFRL